MDEGPDAPSGRRHHRAVRLAARVGMVAALLLVTVVLHSLVLGSPSDPVAQWYDDPELDHLDCTADTQSLTWLVEIQPSVRVECLVCGQDVDVEQEVAVERGLAEWKPVIRSYIPGCPDRNS